MPGASAGSGSVSGANIVDESISNADIATDADIERSKLDFGDGLVNDDIDPNAAIDKTKINLANQIGNTELEDAVASFTTVALSSAEILALHTTEKELLPAPGAGKIILIDSVLFVLTAGTQYVNGTTTRTHYNGDTEALHTGIVNTIINSATDQLRHLQAGTSVGTTTYNATAGINQAVLFGLTSATAFITGTGTIKLYIKYRTVTL